ncbi:porin [Microvirga makkahensis]|uniref:Porin n=1 Tax=Microvirga makkahensis TaxID=1128670 RepID=A0A7X3MUN9_9HYPH|nr:porin [Microvirga makkahensis]MXQ13300.1 hypothetical protein [Microvirga makkahensis]
MKHSALILSTLLLSLGNPAQAASSCPPGFAMLQDSDTCVRIGGRVRAETIVRSSRTRKADTGTSQASGRVQMDVRKQTDYGPFRAFISVEGVRR